MLQLDAIALLLCAKSGAATLTVQMRFDSRHRGAPVDPAHLVSDA